MLPKSPESLLGAISLLLPSSAYTSLSTNLFTRVCKGKFLLLQPKLCSTSSQWLDCLV